MDNGANNLNNNIQNNNVQNLQNIQDQNTMTTNTGNKSNNKTIKIILGAAIFAGCLVLGIVIFNLIKPSGISGGNDVINSNTIEQYDLESMARWGNIPLGVSYLIPEEVSSSITNGSHSFSYLHGHKFNYDGGYLNIYVEKSLEGSTDLNNLFLDIYNEKLSDKYAYEFSYTSPVDDLTIESNKNVKIGDFDAVYFETKGFQPSDSDDEMSSKFLGYSLNFNNQYISVYGQIVYENQEEMTQSKDSLLNRLQYMIASFEKYDDESLYSMDKDFNIKSLYDNIAKAEVENNEIIMFNTYGTHNLNGSYRQNEDYLIKLNPENIIWDGTLDGIYDALLSPKIYTDSFGDETLYLKYSLYFTSWKEQGSEYINVAENEVIDETDVRIDDINMKKYILKTTTYKDTYQVIYTFIIDGNPYITQFQYDFDDIDELTKEQLDVFIKSEETVADTLIRTIRKIDDTSENKIYTDLYYYEY